MTKKEMVSELTKKEFDSFISKGKVLVDFFADWCMPCLMMAPVIDELSEKFRGKIKFAKVNIDENSALAQKYKIMSIPNFILFENGKPVDQFIGAMAAEDFEDKLRKQV
jgi:thioredoxin 1